MEKGDVLCSICKGYCEVGREGVFILFVSPKFPLCVLWRRVIEKGQELLWGFGKCVFFLAQNIALVVCSGLCVKFCEMCVKVICFGAGRLLLSSVVAGVFC